MFYVNQSKNSTAGLDYGTYTYQAFVSDTINNWNQTEQRTITIAEDTCVCAGPTNNWQINMGDYCNITSNCDLVTGNLSFIYTGYVHCDAEINTFSFDYMNLSSGQTLWINSSCYLH